MREGKVGRRQKRKINKREEKRNERGEERSRTSHARVGIRKWNEGKLTGYGKAYHLSSVRQWSCIQSLDAGQSKRIFQW